MLLHKCALLSIVDLITDISTQLILHRKKDKKKIILEDKKHSYILLIVTMTFPLY